MRAIDPQGESGFTLIEIMVSMVILVIGLLGILALQMTTVKGNRMSRELERGKVFATAMMEDLRSRPNASIAGLTYPDVTTADGVTYTRSFTTAAVAGSATLMMITTTVTFAENDDPTDTHTATLQMMRTVPESNP
jgi:type IV pilus modification protein PilV